MQHGKPHPPVSMPVADRWRAFWLLIRTAFKLLRGQATLEIPQPTRRQRDNAARMAAAEEKRARKEARRRASSGL